MSDKLGPIHYNSKEEHVFLGREIGKPREHSESIQCEIDQEVKSLLQSQYELAKKILSENLDTLHALAKAVVEKETLDADEIDRILRGEGFSPGPQGGPSGPQGSQGGSDSGPGVSVAA